MLGKSFKIVSVLMLLALAATAQTIPAGTRLTVRVGSEISSGTAKAGDRFDATLAHRSGGQWQDSGQDGRAGPRQGDLREIQRTAARSGRTHAAAYFAYRSMDGWFRSPLTSYFVKGKGHTKSNATKIGGGAAPER